MAQITLRQEDIDKLNPNDLNLFKNTLGVDNLTPGTYQYGNTATANNQTANNQMFGVSGTNTQALTGGALNNITDYIPQAQTLMSTLYGKTPEQQEREDRINTGMMFLNFFTKMAAEASKPGATGLGSASIAGADTAQLFIDRVNKDRARKLKERQGVVSLATQLYAKDKPTGAPKDYTVVDANMTNRTLGTNLKQGDKVTLTPNLFAKLPIGSVVGFQKDTAKATKPDKYKILNVAEFSKYIDLPSTNPLTGEAWKEGDTIDLTADQFGKVPLGTLSTFKEITPAKPNPFEKLRLDVTNVVEKYIDNINEIDPLDATTFNSSIFQIQKDTFRTIDGEDGTKQTIVEEGLDLLTILKKSYGEEKINNLLARMGVEQKSDTPITDQINKENKNKIEPKEKEIEEDGSTTEYNIVKVGNKNIRVLSKKKDKMSKELVVSLANSKQALKDLDLAVKLFFPNGKYNPKISYQTSTLGGNSLGDARVAYQTMKRAIEVILRLRTGAQAPEPEVKSYMDQYMPSILDGEVEAELKLNALIDFFEEVAKGINEGRRPDDKTWVRRPKSNVVKDAIRDGGKIGDRKIKIIQGVPHIQKEKGSDVYVPIK